MAESATETAPAKLNLALHVIGRRSDGYHALEMLVAFAEIGDELEALPAPRDRLRITGPFAAMLGSGEGNLVLRALAAFRAAWPDALPAGIDLTLVKNLPVAAGLGGGSADAAAALRLFSAMSGLPIPFAALLAIAEKLGADVPVCLYSRPAEVRGIGEIVEPLRSFPEVHVVLVNPLLPLATAEVFRKLERRENSGLPPLDDPLTRPAQLALWLAETRNDLDAPALGLIPAIGNVTRAVAALGGCIMARMSGSGASVFGLFGSGALAHQAAHDLRAKWPAYWVAASPLIGVEGR